MTAHTAALLEYLRASRDLVLQQVDAVPVDRRRVAPAPGAWSVVDVLEHLASVERGIGKLVRRGAASAPRAPADHRIDVPQIIARLQSLQDRSRRLDAPERVRPQGGITEAEARAAFDETRQTLVDAVEATDGLDVGGTSAPHMVLGPLNVYEWIVFVGSHERRHAAQIRETADVLARAAAPGAGS